jgi:hypothetical protein
VDEKGKWSLQAKDNPTREKLKRHTLSAAYLQNDVLAVTSPNGNCLSLWNATNGSLIKSFDLKRVSGVVAVQNGKQALISTHDGQMFELNVPRLSIQTSKLKWIDSLKWGAHLGSSVV